MAKRFFNTSLIEEDWYIELSLKKRELLRYCESKCDGAGIFNFNSKIASTYIGEKTNEADFEKLPISKMKNGKYFLIGFCNFQNGKLSEKSPAHKPIFKSLIENEINEEILSNRVFNRVLDTLQEKEIEKEKVKEIEKENAENLIFDEFRKLYQGTKKGNETEFENFKKQKNWKIILPLLLPTLKNQISNRQILSNQNKFVPEWKNLQTWINQKCWEDEITPSALPTQLNKTAEQNYTVNSPTMELIENGTKIKTTYLNGKIEIKEV
jgi:hypothetical protein